MNQNGILITARAFNATSTAGLPATVAIQIGKGIKGINTTAYRSVGKVDSGTTDFYNYLSNTRDVGMLNNSYNETTGILFLDAGTASNTAVTAHFLSQFVDGFATSGYLVINASRSLPLLAVPVPLTAYLKDVKPSGTAGGTFTSGAWQTRTLNTVQGDGSIVSLSANQFTLGPGKYEREASAPAFRVNNHQLKLRNITLGADLYTGTMTFSGADGNFCTSVSLVNGVLNLNEATTFQVQHRCSTTKTTDGFGFAAGFGASVVYTQVKITKKS
jgi:hypothetical protein